MMEINNDTHSPRFILMQMKQFVSVSIGEITYIANITRIVLLYSQHMRENMSALNFY